MTLADSNYSIEESLSEYSRASVAEVRKLVKKMTLGDYIALANALDADDDTKIDALIRKYDTEIIEENSNVLPQQIKNTIAKIAQKPASSVKAPSMVNMADNKSETIVSADDRSKTIATANDKGEITIHDASKPEIKQQIALETALSDLKRLLK